MDIDIEKYLNDRRVKDILVFLNNPENFSVSKEDYSYSKNHEEDDANIIDNIVKYVYVKTS